MFFCTLCQSRFSNSRGVTRHLALYHIPNSSITPVATNTTHTTVHPSRCDQLSTTNEQIFQHSDMLLQPSAPPSITRENDYMCDQLPILNESTSDLADTLCQSTTQHKITRASFDYFSSKENRLYFWQDYCHPTGGNGGKRGIVGRCFRGWHAQDCLATDDETKFMFNLTSVLLDSNDANIERTVEMFRIIARNTAQNQESIFPNIRLPESLADIRRTCLSNKYSIMQSLPTPTVNSIEMHSYISLSEQLDIMSAHGIVYHMENLDDETKEFVNFMATRAGMVLRDKMRGLVDTDESVSVGHYILWSDGFTRHHVKTHKGSVWILTATVCPPGGNSNSKFHTYLLAIGPGNAVEHTPVLETYIDEMHALQTPKWRYNGISRKFELTAFEMIFFLADRPERCSVNFIKNGGSTGLRWRYAGKVNETTLPSCTHCYHDRIRLFLTEVPHTRTTVPTVYHSCGDFDCMGSSKALQQPTPLHYPSVAHPDSPIPPSTRSAGLEAYGFIEQTYEILVNCVQYMAFNIATNTWSRTQALAYYMTLALSTKLFQVIWDEAKRLGECNMLHVVTSDKFSAIPKLWLSGYKLHQFLDSPMHHLFQGITKSLIAALNDFLTSNSQFRAFARAANDTIQSLRDLKLDWCKIELFHSDKYSTGGWVAESYLAYARFLPFIYANIMEESLIKGDIPGSNQCAILIHSAHTMISHLMSSTKVNGDGIDDYVKLFLSACSEFCQAIQDESICGFWSGKANFISLLNLYEQVKHFGPLRHYWEGTQERFIQNVKPLLSNIRSTNGYFDAKLFQHHQSMALAYVDQPTKVVKEYHRYQKFKVYDSFQSCQDCITEGTPLSLVLLGVDSTMLCVVYKLHSKFAIHPIRFVHGSGSGRVVLGLWYEELAIDSNSLIQMVNTMDDISRLCSDYGIAFKCNVMAHSHQTNHSFFRAIVLSSWGVRQRDSTIGLPTLSKEVYWSFL